ncbi:MAG: UDP-3-O-[3-hydroxymyristoyl] N-acetylglucosamine deacetylase [Gammaproteobacteria bacterium]|uniref:UDP-3-O-acyl-N-acetylglucosamine deacetylase n=1 Tax=OM182 bacterium TaxID=2510334 RepID=A0A520S4T6_9GAMM|nr:UDP-3-O-[3-hydroxymyristoyl] N-acetylglucosamine deacetylase [Gammaproteobacteria bacterium]OUV67532.1 MAG: UDP-3-O-[3-hydroxymyristoyl] N-acetylglucosamine deacetylase [Gammaproteobacteria bacterium TMED133]RZO77505.1 MAG: UDP-3-O-acyl-N-acetylglucosamine deacetylase [OM182 bacterium]
MIRQRTLKNVIRATGVGLHTGEKVYLTLRPAPVDTGVVFVREDVEPVVQIPALTEFVGDTTLATTIVRDGHRISTIEHLMSALCGLAIDNILVEISGPEMPIMDGSSATFVFLIQSAGIEEQNALKKFIRFRKEVAVSGDFGASYEQSVAIKPYDGFRISHTIIYDNPIIKEQTATVDVSSTSYVKDISRARTFGLMQEFDHLREKNLAQGGSLDNAVVVDDFRVLNDDGLRHKDEFVRHKILDAIGDLYLLGHSLIGEFIGFKSGHTANHALRKAILEQPESWEMVTFDSKEEAPLAYSFPLTIEQL